VGLAERTDRLVVALAGAAVTEWGLPQAFYAVGLSWVAAASLITVIQRIVFTKRALEAA
jgi:CDP-diacylglycerol--glycerol-3-phosphate 3-phosphatidyltransferase